MENKTLKLKWVNIVGMARNIALNDGEDTVIAIPMLSPEDEWLLICSNSEMAQDLIEKLEGTQVDLNHEGLDIEAPALTVRTGAKSKDGDLLEISLVAALRYAGYSEIEESDKVWAK